MQVSVRACDVPACHALWQSIVVLRVLFCNRLSWSKCVTCPPPYPPQCRLSWAPLPDPSRPCPLMDPFQLQPTPQALHTNRVCSQIHRLWEAAWPWVGLQVHLHTAYITLALSQRGDRAGQLTVFACALCCTVFRSHQLELSNELSGSFSRMSVQLGRLAADLRLT